MYWVEGSRNIMKNLRIQGVPVVSKREYNSGVLDSSWNVRAHGDAREGKWRGNWPMEWVASTLHTTLEHGVSIITAAGAHTSAASSRMNWRPCRFKWTRPFRRKTKSGFCACAITFQLGSNESLNLMYETDTKYCSATSVVIWVRTFRRPQYLRT
jgi:hypothetical protein